MKKPNAEVMEARVRELIETGKSKGVLTYKEIVELLGDVELDSEQFDRILDTLDVLVDGPFVQAQHSYQLPWRGSHNQRLIDVPATRARGRIVLWETHEDFPVKPPSW